MDVNSSKFNWAVWAKHLSLYMKHHFHIFSLYPQSMYSNYHSKVSFALLVHLHCYKGTKPRWTAPKPHWISDRQCFKPNAASQKNESHSTPDLLSNKRTWGKTNGRISKGWRRKSATHFEDIGFFLVFLCCWAKTGKKKKKHGACFAI